jgi:hypothetical protein
VFLIQKYGFLHQSSRFEVTVCVKSINLGNPRRGGAGGILHLYVSHSVSFKARVDHGSITFSPNFWRSRWYYCFHKNMEKHIQILRDSLLITK